MHCACSETLGKFFSLVKCEGKCQCYFLSGRCECLGGLEGGRQEGGCGTGEAWYSDHICFMKGPLL